MKVLKIILILTVIVVGGAAIYLATLDPNYDVSRSIHIDAKPATVFNEVAEFKTWPEWNIWFDKDSTLTPNFDGPTTGNGAGYSWTGADGKGEIKFVEFEPNSKLATELTFEGMGTSYGGFTFEPEDGGTKVTWNMNGETGFIGRAFAANMDKFVGPDFEAGLKKLKNNIESRQPEIEISEMNLKPQTIYYVHRTLSFDELNSETIGTAYGEVSAFLGEESKFMNGMPMAIYHTWDEENETTEVDFAMPCASEKEGNEAVMRGESPSGKMLRAKYYGEYDGLGAAHEALEAHMENNGYEWNGPAMEVYVTDPTTVEDPSEILTEVYYSVK